MPRKLRVMIPLLVGSNGQWCANGYTCTAHDGPDWGFMADSLEKDGKFPNAEKKYMVSVVVELPDDGGEVVAGTAMAVEE